MRANAELPASSTSRRGRRSGARSSPLPSASRRLGERRGPPARGGRASRSRRCGAGRRDQASARGRHRRVRARLLLRQVRPAAQRERFEAHIDAARQTGLPLIVHTRDAEDDTAEILGRAVKQGGVTGVLHCFTGSAELAARALDLGFFVSLSGIVTFKNAQDLQQTRARAPARLAARGDRFARSSRPSRTAGRSASRRSSPTPPAL